MKPPDLPEPFEDSDGDPALPDDVWERFAQDSERDIRATAPKEPSARALMVTRRLREQQEREDREDRTPKWLPGRTAARRTGSDWRRHEPPASRRRGLWSALGVLLLVAVALVALNPARALSWLPGRDDGNGGTPARLPAETARPLAPPSAAAGRATLDRPFAGSPAERWADGADGIVLPEARAVGGLSKDRVAAGLATAKQLIVAADLDRATLRGERPEAALALIDPLRQKKLLADLDTALRGPDEAHDPLEVFSRFDPTEVRPAGDVVKVRGRTTFAAGPDGSLTVHADYTFVYPLEPENGRPEVARTIVRRVLDFELADPSRIRVTPGRIALVRYASDSGNTDCTAHDGFLHPSFPSQLTTQDPQGPATDPYDRSRALTDRADCGTVTRT